jgi:hypothetical protein
MGKKKWPVDLPLALGRLYFAYNGRNSIDAIEFLPESFSESFSFSQTSVLSPPFDRSPS